MALSAPAPPAVVLSVLIEVLGDIAVRGVHVRSASVRRVLARLAVSAGEVVTDATLTDVLWGDEPPPSARRALQTHVGALRDLLEPDRARRSPGRYIVTLDGGYLLRVEPSELDLLAFEQAVARAERADTADPTDAAAAAARALEQWAEPVLGDCVDEPWARSTVSRVSECHQRLLGIVAEAELARGHNARVITLVDDALERYPYNETLIGHLLVALWRSNRQADALEAYQAARRRLLDDLGVDPGPTLQSLELAILTQDASLDRGLVGTGAGHAFDPSGTSFIGREHELAQVEKLLDEHRLVTLVGPGGVGKTRLARRVASQCADRFAGGAVLVDFSTTTGVECRRVFAERLGIGEHPLGDLGAGIRYALSGSSRLVVLDTCEHLGDHALALVGELLAIEGCTVIVTSRSPLGHRSEWLVAVSPLDDGDALRLLLDRSGFGDSADDALVEICRRLDGLPLAIELAAGRLRSLPPVELARLVSRSRASLRGGADRPARHRGLDETIRWSYDLLSETERDVLQRLAALRGDFTVETAVAFAAADGADETKLLNTLAGLVDRSMVSRADVAGTRYRILDTVRDHVRSRAAASGTQARLDAAHAAWVLRRARRAFLGLGAEDLGAIAGEVRPALDHFRAAGDPAELELAVCLGTFWLEHGRVSEGRRTIADATASHPTAPLIQSVLAVALDALLGWYQGDPVANRRLTDFVHGNLEASDDGGLGVPGLAQLVRACDAFTRDDLDQAERWVASADAALPVPSKPRILLLYFGGNIAWYRGDLTAAVLRYQEQRSVAATIGDRFAEAQGVRYEGMARALAGEHERGWALGEVGLRRARELGDDMSLAQAHACLALTTHVAGDSAVCAQHAGAALRIARRQVDAFALRVSLPLCAWVDLRSGAYRRAALSLGFLRHLLAESGQHLPPPLRALQHHLDEEVGNHLGEVESRRTRVRGAGLRLDELIELVAP